MQKQAASNMGEKILPGGTLVKIDTPGKNWRTGGDFFFLHKNPTPPGKNQRIYGASPKRRCRGG